MHFRAIPETTYCPSSLGGNDATCAPPLRDMLSEGLDEEIVVHHLITVGVPRGALEPAASCTAPATLDGWFLAASFGQGLFLRELSLELCALPEQVSSMVLSSSVPILSSTFLSISANVQQKNEAWNIDLDHLWSILSKVSINKLHRIPAPRPHGPPHGVSIPAMICAGVPQSVPSNLAVELFTSRPRPFWPQKNGENFWVGIR